MTAYYIKHRLLKAKKTYPTTKTGLSALELKIELMKPSFELFLMMRTRSLNQKGICSSIQFFSEKADQFYFINIENHPGYNASDYIENFLVAEPNLDKDRDWIVRLVSPSGCTEDITTISYNSFYGWYLHHNPHKAKHDAEVIFIGGTPKSGTTWVERIINSHPDALSIGENNFFGWPSVEIFEKLMRSDPPPWFATGVRQSPPFWSSLSMMMAGRASSTLLQLAAAANVSCVADKTPSYAKNLNMIFATLPQAKYIHCIRNPLDIMVSRFFHEQKLLINSPDLSMLPEDNNLRMYVRNFDASKPSHGKMFHNNRLFQWALQQTISDIRIPESNELLQNIMFIKYEDLINKFNDTVSNLFRFISLPVSCELINDVQERNSIGYYKSGNNLFRADADFFRSGLSNQYIHWFSEEQICFAKHFLVPLEFNSSYFE